MQPEKYEAIYFKQKDAVPAKGTTLSSLHPSHLYLYWYMFTLVTLHHLGRGEGTYVPVHRIVSKRRPKSVSKRYEKLFPKFLILSDSTQMVSTNDQQQLKLLVCMF